MSRANYVGSTPQVPAATAMHFGDATATNRGLAFQGNVYGNAYFSGECIFYPPIYPAWHGLAND